MIAGNRFTPGKVDVSGGESAVSIADHDLNKLVPKSPFSQTVQDSKLTFSGLASFVSEHTLSPSSGGHNIPQVDRNSTGMQTFHLNC